MNTPALNSRPESGVGHYLRDIVNGACDGVVTTLAIVAGAAGANFEARVSIVLGIVNLAADGVSMGASNYLGMKSELEQSGASVEREAPARHGMATLVAFVAAGVIPLSSFALGLPRQAQFPAAFTLAILTLAFVGGARSRFTNRPRARCAFEMAAIGGGAGALAYLLGLVVDHLLLH